MFQMQRQPSGVLWKHRHRRYRYYTAHAVPRRVGRASDLKSRASACLCPQCPSHCWRVVDSGSPFRSPFSFNTLPVRTVEAVDDGLVVGFLDRAIKTQRVAYPCKPVSGWMASFHRGRTRGIATHTLAGHIQQQSNPSERQDDIESQPRCARGALVPGVDPSCLRVCNMRAAFVVPLPSASRSLVATLVRDSKRRL